MYSNAPGCNVISSGIGIGQIDDLEKCAGALVIYEQRFDLKKEKEKGCSYM